MGDQRDTRILDARLDGLANELVECVLAFNPGMALFLGRHEYDRELEDGSPGAIAAHCSELARLRARTSALTGLSSRDEVEREILLARIDGSLHEYRVLAPHCH